MRGAGKDVLDMISKEDPKIAGDAEDKVKSAIEAFASSFDAAA